MAKGILKSTVAILIYKNRCAISVSTPFGEQDEFFSRQLEIVFQSFGAHRPVFRNDVIILVVMRHMNA